MAFYPPAGFHFLVEVLGLPPAENDARFTEVGGLSVEIGSEEVPEGGENRFVQRYPTRRKYPELVLKRGLFVGSEVTRWIRRCLDGDVVDPHDLDVRLLNAAHEPLLTWHVAKAWPTRWGVSDLNATANGFVVETLQLSYQWFRLDGG
jgi:phage tail-like protein